jgi:hypothetical protein
MEVEGRANPFKKASAREQAGWYAAGITTKV